MLANISKWLVWKWRPAHPGIGMALQVTFSSLHGQAVLQHLIDNVYCQVYTGSDPIALAAHNGRRSVVHELLVLLDQAEHPQKYSVNVAQPGENDARVV